MKSLKFTGNNKQTGWAVSTKKNNWHYFRNHKSICKYETYVMMPYVFVPKINRNCDICSHCRKLIGKDKFL